MTREIKFRMWDFENKEIIDGDSLAFEEYAPITHLLSQNGIMQYTGLKDMTGKEIYEGDIVRHGFKMGVCRIYRGCVMYSYGEPKKDSQLATYHYCMEYGHENQRVEVLGNIYKHPHLLAVMDA